MRSPFLTFVKKIFIFSIIIGVLMTVCILIMPAKLVSPALPFLLPFFFALTLISHYLQIKSSEKSFARFTSNYMLVTSVKLMTLLIVLLVYVLLNRNDAIPFIISFFILYILYSVFEVIELQNIKKNNN